MTEDTAANPPAPLWGRMLCTWLTASDSTASEALRLRDQTAP
jgi:hypothetical protein